MIVWGLALGVEAVTGARHMQFISLPNIEKALQFYFVLSYFTMYANLLIKASMCAMLLRIMQSRGWRIAVWCLLATIAIVAIVTTITNSLECTPASAFWNLTERFEKCWDEIIVSNIANAMGAYFVATDFILALLPLVFIRQLKRPRRDKIVLSVLMGCGLMATAAGIVKIVYTERVVHMGDFFYNSVRLGIFSNLELFIGIIACCAPCLKSLLDKVLRRMGIDLTRTNTQQKSSRYGSRSAQNGVKLSSFSSRADAHVWEGEPAHENFTDASAAGPYISPNDKDVIVKESCVSWESTPA